MIVVTRTAVAQVLIRMEWIADPSIRVGLVTLVVIELMLGIDDLVSIAILAEKLPPAHRGHTQIAGLMLVMAVRLLLLTFTSWPVTLTQSLFNFHSFTFSARDLTILFGDPFLLFETTIELGEWLEGKDSNSPTQCKGVKFWGMVTQIVILDIIFSLDSVVTATGIVDHSLVMMAAVVVAISLMLMAGEPLTQLVNNHPMIVIPCLSFLLVTGFSLVAGGSGLVIPKGYLYATISFSVMIKVLNQLAIFNRGCFLSTNQTLRQRTTKTVMCLLSRQKGDAELDAETASMLLDHGSRQIFNPQERRTIERVLSLSQRAASNIVTSCRDTEHIGLNMPEEEIRQLLERNQHTRLVVTDGDDAEDLLGAVHIINLLQQSLHGEPLNLWVLIRQPLVFPETLSLLPALEQFRNARMHFASVVDKFGSMEGVVTLSGITETIVGNLPNEVEEIDTRCDIQKNADGSWTANGRIPLEDLVQYVLLPLDEKHEYHAIAGLLMEYLQRIPKPDEEVQVGNYLLKTLQVESHRVQKVQIMPLREDGEMKYEV